MFKSVFRVILMLVAVITVNAADNNVKKTTKTIKLESKADILITLEISKDKDAKIYSHKVYTTDGAKAIIKMAKEIYFPVKWEAPVFEKKDSKITKIQNPVPVFGKPTTIGLNFFASPQIVNQPGKGEVIFMYGSIVLTSNSTFKKIHCAGSKFTGMQNTINTSKISFMLLFVDSDEQKLTFESNGSEYRVKIKCEKIVPKN